MQLPWTGPEQEECSQDFGRAVRVSRFAFLRIPIPGIFCPSRSDVRSSFGIIIALVSHPGSLAGRTCSWRTKPWPKAKAREAGGTSRSTIRIRIRQLLWHNIISSKGVYAHCKWKYRQNQKERKLQMVEYIHGYKETCGVVNPKTLGLPRLPQFPWRNACTTVWLDCADGENLRKCRWYLVLEVSLAAAWSHRPKLCCCLSACGPMCPYLPLSLYRPKPFRMRYISNPWSNTSTNSVPPPRSTGVFKES